MSNKTRPDIEDSFEFLLPLYGKERGGLCPGVLYPGGLCQGDPPSPCGQTDTCEIITLPQTLFAGGNNDPSALGGRVYMLSFVTYGSSIKLLPDFAD